MWAGGFDQAVQIIVLVLDRLRFQDELCQLDDDCFFASQLVFTPLVLIKRSIACCLPGKPLTNHSLRHRLIRNDTILHRQ